MVGMGESLVSNSGQVVVISQVNAPNVKEGVWVTCDLDITLSESDAGASLSCLNVGMATDPSIGIDYDDVKVVATYVLEDSG